MDRSSSTENPETSFFKKYLGCNDLNYRWISNALSCPLPNEHSVVISALMYLCATSTKKVLLKKSPQLLNLLVGHAGVFDCCATRGIIVPPYASIGLHSDFWEHSIDNSALRMFLCECFLDMKQESELHNAQKVEKRNVVENINSDDERKELTSNLNHGKNTVCCTNCICSGSGVEHLFSLCLQHTDDYLLVPLGAPVNKFFGRRIECIAAILLCYSEDWRNAKLMAVNINFRRFLVLSIHSTSRKLKEMALSMLTNISKFMQLKEPYEDPIVQILLSYIESEMSCSLINSSNHRGLVVCLPILQGWIQVEKDDCAKMYKRNAAENLAILCRSLNMRNLYQIMYEILVKTDVYSTIDILELLLVMTEHGEVTCDDISGDKDLLKSLLRLMTVERIYFDYEPENKTPGGIPVNGNISTINLEDTQEQISKEEDKNLLDKSDSLIKSVRITAALILRNIAKNSIYGRNELRRYEFQIATTVSCLEEISYIGSQILYEFNSSLG